MDDTKGFRFLHVSSTPRPLGRNILTDQCTCRSHREEVRMVRFSWDGEFLATAGADRCIDIVSTYVPNSLPGSPH